MIGVILWSDMDERKAVVWCEDQGDLAFLGCAGSSKEQTGYFEAGDILEFDLEIDGNFRRARNPKLVNGYNPIDVAGALTAHHQVQRPTVRSSSQGIPVQRWRSERGSVLVAAWKGRDTCTGHIR